MQQKQRMIGGLPLLLITCCLFVPTLVACVKLPRRSSLPPSQTATQALPSDALALARINLNTAQAEELEKLPGIGRALAARIVSHRQQYGRFRRAEHLIMVRGIGDRRFRRLRHIVTVE